MIAESCNLDGTQSPYVGLRSALRRRRFPGSIGAIAMGTVVRGERPARLVAHTPDGLWLVSDGVDKPHVDDAQLVHLQHLVSRDPTLRDLAELPPGFQAVREQPGDPWTQEPFAWTGDESA